MNDTALGLLLHAGWFVKLILLVLVGCSVVSWALVIVKYLQFRRTAREAPGLLQTVAARQERAQPERLQRLLRQAAQREIDRLQDYLPFLGTTASATPFIGLLGTVWGIMNAFRGIGAAGSASLAVVAPGIAEALITTAAGLGAAIPAVVAYNYYLSRSRRAIIEMEDFSEELLGLFAKGAKA